MATTNQNDDPLTNQAELGYRIVSTLIGRRSLTRPADVRVQRDHTSLVMKLVDIADNETPLQKDTPVTMYIEREVPARDNSAGITIVTRKADGKGTVTLERGDGDKVIAALIIQMPSGNVDLGRIDPPDKPPPAEKLPIKKSPAKQRSPRKK